jgi:hypothetical protein
VVTNVVPRVATLQKASKDILASLLFLLGANVGLQIFGGLQSLGVVIPNAVLRGLWVSLAEPCHESITDLQQNALLAPVLQRLAAHVAE